jgi:hypothetical protein
MTQTDGADEPLDPALEKVRRKMIRLLAVSIAVLMVGLIAVLSAVVYRAGRDGEETAGGAPATPAEAVLTVPTGARITATAGLSRDRAMVVVETADGRQEILVLDAASGGLVSRTRLQAAQP